MVGLPLCQLQLQKEHVWRENSPSQPYGISLCKTSFVCCRICAAVLQGLYCE